MLFLQDLKKKPDKSGRFVSQNIRQQPAARAERKRYVMINEAVAKAVGSRPHGQNEDGTPAWFLVCSGCIINPEKLTDKDRRKL